MRALAALCLILPLAACGPTLIVMKNPKTGEMHDCQGVNVSQIMAAQDASNCATAYESQGWVRVGP